MKHFMKALLILIPSICLAQQEQYQTINSDEFGSKITLNIPSNFKSIEKKTSENVYIEEFTVNTYNLTNWKELYTVSIQKAVALTPNFSVQQVLKLYSKSFRDQCPKSFYIKNIDSLNESTEKQFVSILRCGDIFDEQGIKVSETSIIDMTIDSDNLVTYQYSLREKQQKNISNSDIENYTNKLLEMKTKKLDNQE